MFIVFFVSTVAGVESDDNMSSSTGVSDVLEFKVVVFLLELIFFIIKNMQATKQIKSDVFNVKINATANPKAYTATVFFEFDTTEKQLLNALLNKYNYEKISMTGVNPNNKILLACLGDCCIALTVPPELIIQNIVLLLSYLAKTELKGESKKYVSGKYSKLMKDIKNVDVYIVGKVKRFIASKLENKEKLDKVAESLGKLQIKDRAEITATKSHTFDNSAIMKGSSDIAMMYLSIVLKDIGCTLSKSSGEVKITFLTEADACKFKELVFTKEKIIYQTQIRSFLTQSGTIGSPSAKDKDGKAFKAKVDGILASENTLAYIYSHLRGFDYKFKNADDLKVINNDALTIASNITMA